MTAPTTIELLADHTESLPTLADWYTRAWPPYYGADGPGDAHADLASRCNRDSIPVGFVALQKHELCGVAALDSDAATNLAPSVVGLLVADKFRGQGVAGKLLRSAIRHAGRLGFQRVFVSTNLLGDHLERNGWHLFGEAQFLNEEQGRVYVFDLADR